MKAWRYVSVLAFIVVVLSAINIGFVGIAKYDIVGHLARGTFGDVTTGSRIVFTVIGVAGLVMIPWLVTLATGRTKVREEYSTSDAWLMTGWVALLFATLGALNWGSSASPSTMSWAPSPDSPSGRWRPATGSSSRWSVSPASY